MDVLRGLNFGSKPFFAMTKSSDNFILGLFLENGELDLKWVRSDTDGITGIRTLSEIEKAVFAISIEQTPQGIPKVLFGHEFFEQEDYFLINDPANPDGLCVYYESKVHGPSIAREVFIDLETSQAFCKAETETLVPFVETKALNLGSLAFFLKK